MLNIHKHKILYSLTTIVLGGLFTGCSNNNDPTETLPTQIIRGELNDNLESGQLPSSSLPSQALPAGNLPAHSLPAMALPGYSLPTIEVDETPSVASLRSLEVVMQASQEVGDAVVESTTTLMATGVFSLDEISGDISATVTASNVAEGDAITNVHIHSGFAGENGDVLVAFVATNGNPNEFTLSTNITNLNVETGNDLETFLDGGWYLNLQTTSNPGGHLRGQLFTNEIDVVRTQLQGQQQNPPIDNAEGIAGVGYVTLNPDEDEIVANVSVEGFEPFLNNPNGPVHLHTGFAGENGPILLPLQPVDGSDTVFRGTQADATGAIDFADIEIGGAYINVHSAENTDGELRGQIIPDTVNVARSVLQGAQQNPPVINEDGVAGIAYVTFSEEQDSVVALVTVEGFTPSLDGASSPVHIHSAYAGANGGVILPLPVVAGSDDLQYFVDETNASNTIDFAVLAAGGYYVNVHSAANGGGEIRGQIAPRNIDIARTELQGAQQNPPVENAAGIAGVGYVTLNSENGEIQANVTVEGFIPSFENANGPVHLHSGFAGENGPILLPLQAVDGSETVFAAQSSALAEVDFDAIAQGGTYINVHSADNASGEIRGQVVPSGVDVSRIVLEGQQQNPPVINAEGVAGLGYVTVKPADNSIVGIVTVEGFEPFLNNPMIGPVHLHSGFAGENGSVVLPLLSVDGSSTLFKGTEDNALENVDIDFEAIAQGGTYINVHSADNASGEIRGQVVPSGVDVSRIVLEGQQQNPPVVNEDGIAGVGYITFNANQENITGIVTVEGFEPFLNNPNGPVHLHSGFAGENGGILLPLLSVDGSSTLYKGTEDDALDGVDIDFNAIAQGGTYINVHSADNGSGEIRGQVVPSGVDVSRIVLEGQQQNPPVDNAAGIAGVGYVTVKPADNSIVGIVTVEGFEPFLNDSNGPVHLHSGFAGENGGILLPLLSVDGSSTLYKGTEDDSNIDFNNIALGGTYINVHSAANGSGELRGQVAFSDTSIIRTVLEGQQQNPPVTNAEGIAGIGYITVTPQAQSIVGLVTVEGFVPFFDNPIGPVHLHDGYAGSNGLPILALFAVGDSTTTYRATGTDAELLDDIDFDKLLNGGTYLNVHSQANASGEIRGQVLVDNVRTFRTLLDGATALPEANSTIATGVGYLTVNLTSEMFNANVQVVDFDPAATTATVNIGGDNNTVHATLAAGANGSFSGTGQVANLQGLLGGAYSLQVTD